MAILALDREDRHLMIQLVGQMNDDDIRSLIHPDAQAAVRNLRDRIRPFVESGRDFEVALIGQVPVAL